MDDFRGIEGITRKRSSNEREEGKEGGIDRALCAGAITINNNYRVFFRSGFVPLFREEVGRVFDYRQNWPLVDRRYVSAFDCYEIKSFRKLIPSRARTTAD